MARNQEKAMSMLNRWTQMKRDWMTTDQNQRRPKFASEVKTLAEAEKWRGQLIREISKNMDLIQDGSKGEHRIRDLNDQINKLMRIKHHWERRIKELGGADYRSASTRIVDIDGSGAFGEDGYYYFGAAKNLPGIRELFEKKLAAAKDAKHRAELRKYIDAEYYGFCDEEDGIILDLEAKAELKAHEQAKNEWNEKYTDQTKEINKNDDMKFKSILVNVPSQDEIQNLILAKRKREIMQKYSKKPRIE